MNFLYSEMIKLGGVGIAIVAFCEAIFLPIPMEVIAIPVYLTDQKKSIFLCLVLIAFSGLGGIVGYFIGKHGGQKLLNRVVKKEFQIKAKELYERNAPLTLATASFTPIPIEAYTLTAGWLQIPFFLYIRWFVFSRILKHLPIGVLIYFYGKDIIATIEKYSFLATVVIVTLLILYFSLKKPIYRYFENRSKRKRLK